MVVETITAYTTIESSACANQISFACCVTSIQVASCIIAVVIPLELHTGRVGERQLVVAMGIGANPCPAE
jgi:hypothetical protein